MTLPISDLLTRPLPFDQVAPRGFLLVERTAVALGGANEWTLRLVPWLAALASVILFWRLVERTLSGWAVPLAVLLFAVAVPLVSFAGLVKQYAGDVAIAIALMLLILTMRTRDNPLRRFFIAGALGFVAAVFSQASVPMMAGIGLGLAIDWLSTRDRRTARLLATTMPLWAIASGLAVVAGSRSMTPSTRLYMDRFWAEGYVPHAAEWTAAAAWVWGRVLAPMTDPGMLAYPWPAAMAVLAATGMALIWLKERGTALILLGPVVVCLGAAMAGQAKACATYHFATHS